MYSCSKVCVHVFHKSLRTRINAYIYDLKKRKTHSKDFIRVLVCNSGIKRSHEQSKKNICHVPTGNRTTGVLYVPGIRLSAPETVNRTVNGFSVLKWLQRCTLKRPQAARVRHIQRCAVRTLCRDAGPTSLSSTPRVMEQQHVV
jgi:hypothetical protein